MRNCISVLTLILALCLGIGTVSASGVGGTNLESSLGVRINVSGWADLRVEGDLVLNLTNPTESADSNPAKWAVHANTPVRIEFASQGFGSDIDYLYPGSEWGTIEEWEFYKSFHPMNYFTYKVRSPGDGATVYTFKPFSPDWNPSNLGPGMERVTSWSDNLYGSKSGQVWVSYHMHPDPGFSGWMFDSWDGWEGLRADTYTDTVLITVSGL